MKRTAGILFPIFSLPSNYGIGTFGKEAYRFVDFLYESKQSYWQILPLGQTSYGDSPYQSFSSFAGNPYFIDLDLLSEDGLLDKDDLCNLKDEDKIDYGYLFNTRFNVLYKAYLNGINKYQKEFEKFIKDNKDWLEGYALFISLKKYFNNKAWIDWEDESIKKRDSNAIKKYQKELNDDILFYEFIQFLFFKQYYALKEYANLKNIKIIGDMPIYVSFDSSDVWENKDNFILDENDIPRVVSGVPPDYFNENGQLWGNPIYDYDFQKKNKYIWWINRISGISRLYDVLRIDHFRGFESFWAVPYKEETAKNGEWIKGPGMSLLSIIKEKFKNIDFIAEDLGVHTKETEKLVDDFGFPGMRVLEFAFDGSLDNDNLPINYKENCVCYVGTHDNEPIMGFYKEHNREKEISRQYLNEDDSYNFSMIKLGMESKANLFIASMQDYLGLDNSSRINYPGKLGDNWTWRMSKDVRYEDLISKIREYTIMSKRV